MVGKPTYHHPIHQRKRLLKPGLRGPGWLLLGLSVLAVAIRCNNAIHYPIGWGFDAEGNWSYIARLLQSWALPAPDADWSTSHPPLFYYAAAAGLRLLGSLEPPGAVVAVRLASAAAGLGAIVATLWLVRRMDPDRPARSLLAGAVLLFLPAHLYVSAMLSEEILASLFVSIAVAGAAVTVAAPGPGSLALQAGLGACAGLALLTKLSGASVLAAVPTAYVLEGFRRRSLRPWLARAVVYLAVGSILGGWYYARNLVHHGYLYPQGLAEHAAVLEKMPPGDRAPGDYLRLPAATFLEPQLLEPSLQRSVWGSTYATLWFDGHRHFLPRDDGPTRRMGTALTLLGLLPTLAFLAGLGGGVRRWWRGPRGPDGPLLLLTAFTLAGYVTFTWSNPWFVTVKATYLLGLTVPFGFYASGALESWRRQGRIAGGIVAGGIAALVLASAVTFSFGLLFEKTEDPGLPWLGRRQAASASAEGP